MPPSVRMSQPLRVAGFELITSGRIWVIAKALVASVPSKALRNVEFQQIPTIAVTWFGTRGWRFKSSLPTNKINNLKTREPDRWWWLRVSTCWKASDYLASREFWLQDHLQKRLQPEESIQIYT